MEGVAPEIVERADNGIGKVEPGMPLSTTVPITTFIGIALYNVVELNFIIFATFRTRRGLYFWSFLVSTWGIALYSIGFLIKNLKISHQSIFYVTFIIIGWSTMVTGQSIVLYSRLHLVLRSRSQLRLVLMMIIVNAIICHIPIFVMVYGANSNNPEPFLVPYSIYEKVQVTIFFIQELIISGLYIFHTVKILSPEGNIRGKSSRRVMIHLIYVNVIIVILDITILGLEYGGLYDIQTAYKALVYSVKLKLEFSILNRLVELTKGNVHSASNPQSGSRGVHLETFDGGKNKQNTKGNDPGESYRAYVSSGMANAAGNANISHLNDSIVVTTTRIATHSNDEWGVQENERDLESMDARSGVTTDSLEIDSKGVKRSVSPSSSQAELAKDGF